MRLIVPEKTNLDHKGLLPERTPAPRTSGIVARLPSDGRLLTVTGVARVWFATVAALGALAYVGPAVAGPESGSSAGDACETGRAYLSEGEVDKALETYLRSLNATTVPCIDSGLVAVANAKRLEAAYCARGRDARQGRQGR